MDPGGAQVTRQCKRCQTFAAMVPRFRNDKRLGLSNPLTVRHLASGARMAPRPPSPVRVLLCATAVMAGAARSKLFRQSEGSGARTEELGWWLG